MAKGKPSYIDEELSPEQAALDYLARAIEEIRALQGARRRFAWKWLVLSLDSALYMFALCALKGSNWHLVTVETTGGKREPIGFAEAIQRCQSADHMTLSMHSKPLQLTADQQRSLEILHARRKNIEYPLQTWHIEQHEIVTSAVDALEATRQLVLDSGNVRLDQKQRKAVSASLNTGLAGLKANELYKQYVSAKKRAAAGKTAAKR